MIAPRENQLIIEKSASAPWVECPWQWTCSTVRPDGSPRYHGGAVTRTWEEARDEALEHAWTAHGVRI